MKISMAGFVAVAAASVALGGAGCGSSNKDSGFVPNQSSSGGAHDSGAMADGTTGMPDDASYGMLPTGDGSGPKPQLEAGVGCTNLQCDIQTCEGGTPTSITGKVLDPAGNNGLYNVVVFIPNTAGGALPLIPRGVNTASCSCGELFQGEEPVVDTLTAPDGTFTLNNVPSGSNIPLVVQIGKWRKEIVLPTVAPCQSTPAGNINLPKNGSDGLFASIPNIAVSTGFADTLECLLTRIGIDEAEFSGDPNTPNAHVHVFQGGSLIPGLGNSTVSPSSPTSSTNLWDTDADLERYDITLLSCEGAPTNSANSQTISDYVSAGGRVFAEHYHYQFFANQSQFPNTANWTPGGAYSNAITGSVQTTLLSNGQPFPEGQALETFLTDVGALTSNLLPIPVARQDATVIGTNVSTPWVITGPGVSPASTQYFSWDMPFNPPKDDAGVPEYCGRVVFSDLHVSGGGGASEDYTSSTVVPTGCDATAKLAPDEDALEFIFFDLSSCVTPIGYPPKPPPTPQPEAGIQ
jgi:hypothetical protein